jgi:hypothetical protein
METIALGGSECIINVVLLSYTICLVSGLIVEVVQPYGFSFSSKVGRDPSDLLIVVTD